jgi:hypothetical protein
MDEPQLSWVCFIISSKKLAGSDVMVDTSSQPSAQSAALDSSVVPVEVSFQGAIALAMPLVDQLANASAAVSGDLQATIAALVASENGARGFFVTYLGDERLPDALDERVVAALQTAPSIVAPLMTKNLAMSTAMALAHRRNQDEAAAQGSDRVRSRSLQIIRALQSPELRHELSALATSVQQGQGAYADFLKRWGYDVEQQEAIAQAIGDTGLGFA